MRGGGGESVMRPCGGWCRAERVGMRAQRAEERGSAQRAGGPNGGSADLELALLCLHRQASGRRTRFAHEKPPWNVYVGPDFVYTLLSTRRTSRSRSKFLVVPLAGVNLGRDVLGGYGALATGGWVGWEALPSARAITSSTSSSAPCRSRATPLVGSRSPSKSNWDKVGRGTGYCLSKKGVQTLVWWGMGPQ